jgi:hypothetical protein
LIKLKEIAPQKKLAFEMRNAILEKRQGEGPYFKN